LKYNEKIESVVEKIILLCKRKLISIIFNTIITITNSNILSLPLDRGENFARNQVSRLKRKKKEKGQKLLAAFARIIVAR